MRFSEVAARFPEVAEALAELDRRDAIARLHARDPSLWSDDEDEQHTIADRLGWLDVAGGRPDWPETLQALRADVAGAGLSRVVLAGMGGSSLAPEVFATVFPAAPEDLELHVLDSTHPDAVATALDAADLDATLVIVASKSGSTEETASFAAYAAAALEDPRRMVAITDADSPLAAEAAGWRACLRNPADIGGRYSALSLFGMAPAALIGVPTDAVWAEAAAMLVRCGPGQAADANPGAQLAAFAGGLARAGRDKLTLLAAPGLEPLGDWVEQLVAESTGKDGRGIVPVVGEPVGAPAVYGDDRAFVELRGGGQPVDGAAAIAAAGHPVLSVEVAGRLALGAEFLRWELATAWAGVLLGVNPFDEPNVAESKANTAAVLTQVHAGQPLPAPEDGDVEGLLASLAPPDYCAVQCYLAPAPAAAAALRGIRQVIRDETRVPATLGWGPRFLHSTGQLHKGGPDTLVALQIVDTPSGGPAIPGRGHDFATLIRAQALGDLRSLRDHDRRVAQTHVGGAQGLSRLADRVEAALRR